MGYNRYLLKVGGTIVPHNLIQYDTYSVTPDQRLDLDSYRDNSGRLHRNTLSHTATKIEFETVPMIESSKIALMRIFENAYSNALERKLDVEYYNPATSEYATGTFYMPDIQYTLSTEDDNHRLWYSSIRIAFIEY